MCGERERWKVRDEYGVETTEEFYDNTNEKRGWFACLSISHLTIFVGLLSVVLCAQETSQSRHIERVLAFKTMEPSSLTVLSSVSEYIDAMKAHVNVKTGNVRPAMESGLTTFYVNHFVKQSGDLCDDALKLIKIRHAARKVFEDVKPTNASPITERVRAWFRPMVFDIKKAYIELDNAVYDLDPSDRDSVCIQIFSSASRVNFTSRLFFSILEIASWIEGSLRHEVQNLFAYLHKKKIV